MKTQSLELISCEEYLNRERGSQIKHEYRNSVMVAMTGASMRHNLIVANLLRVLGNRLINGPCRVVPSDLRLKIQDSSRYTYPDVMVICDKPFYEGKRQDTILNPSIIIEVLSDSTEAYDRGEKFMHYQRIDSLKEYILVSQKDPYVDRFTRREDSQWLYSCCTGDEAVVTLATIGQEFPLSEFYQGLDWAE